MSAIGTDISIWMILGALLAGSLAGFVYFGGLWWTVKKLPDHSSAFVFMLSYLIRSAAVILVFIMVVRQGWGYLLVALLAFMMIRQLLFWYTDKNMTVEH